MTAGEGLSGFFGKLPARGDFLGWNLAPGFLGPWEAWLDQLLCQAFSSYGAGWAGRVRAGLGWRFALAAGVCGPEPMAGILVPSGDRVGRVFPLTIATRLAPGSDLATVPVAGIEWFAAAEQLAAVATRSDVALDLVGLINAIRALGAPLALAPQQRLARPGWRLDLELVTPPAALWPALIRELVRGAEGRFSLWWTTGGAGAGPSLLAAPGLPEGDAALTLIDGEWAGRGWREPE